MPKIIKVGENLTKLWQKQFWLFFRHAVLLSLGTTKTNIRTRTSFFCTITKKNCNKLPFCNTAVDICTYMAACNFCYYYYYFCSIFHWSYSTLGLAHTGMKAKVFMLPVSANRQHKSTNQKMHPLTLNRHNQLAASLLSVLMHWKYLRN